jgi:hypothetical protein
MATVLDEILDTFYERIGASEEIDAATVKAIRLLLQSGKKLKADDFVALLESAAKDTTHDSDRVDNDTGTAGNP